MSLFDLTRKGAVLSPQRFYWDYSRGQLCPLLVRAIWFGLSTKGAKMARKPADVVAVKLRMKEGLRRQIEKLAKKNGQTVNGETIRLLESAVLAEQLGVGGLDGVVKAVQSSSAAFAVQEMVKQLGLDKPEKNQPLTKRSNK
jgi:hypothetical protein